MTYACIEAHLEHCRELLSNAISSWELAVVYSCPSDQAFHFQLIGCLVGANLQLEKVVQALKEREARPLETTKPPSI